MTTTHLTVQPNASAASALRPLVFDLGVPLGSYYLLRKLGVDPGPRAAGPNPLTLRERDVLSVAADGATIADIAQRLYLSESTVRNYLSSAIGKTGSRNRIEAVQAARANGWL